MRNLASQCLVISAAILIIRNNIKIGGLFDNWFRGWLWSRFVVVCRLLRRRVWLWLWFQVRSRRRWSWFAGLGAGLSFSLGTGFGFSLGSFSSKVLQFHFPHLALPGPLFLTLSSACIMVVCQTMFLFYR